MKDRFNAYYTWLSIPPGEQPPHHYRLLGIELFEQNRDVIQKAADRQSLHLKTFQTGPRGALSQRLMNEVFAAAGCLLVPASKAAYDAQLAATLQAKEKSQDAPAPTILDVNITVSPVAGDASRPAKRGKSSGPRPLSEILKIVVGAAAGLFLAILVLSYFAGIDPLGWSKKSREAQSRQAAKSGSKGLPTASPSPTPAPGSSKGHAHSAESKNANSDPRNKSNAQARRDDQASPIAPAQNGGQSVLGGAGNPPTLPGAALPEPESVPGDSPPRFIDPAANSAAPGQMPRSHVIRPNSPSGVESPNNSSPGNILLVDMEPLMTSVGLGMFRKNAAQLRGTEPFIGTSLRFADEFLYAHATSKLVYKVPAGQKCFTVVGYCPSSRHVRFSISNQEELLAESGVCAVQSFKVDLPDVTTEIHLEVDSLGHGGRDQSFWCYPRLHSQPASEVDSSDFQKPCLLLTAQKPDYVSVGYGKLMVNQFPATWLRPLHPDSIVPCDEYLYAHADSRLQYAIPERATRFSAIGYAMMSQSVKFRVLVDDKLVAQTAQVGIEAVAVDLPAGGKVLSLDMDSVGSTHEDHAFWCYPRFDCSPRADAQQQEFAAAMDKLQKLIASYQAGMLAAKKDMLNDFSQAESKVRASKALSGAAQLAVLDRLKQEQAAFNDHGYLPFSQPMRPAWKDYVKLTKNVEAMLYDAFEGQIKACNKSNKVEAATLLEAERSRLLARSVIARWSVGGWTLYSDGSTNGGGTWTWSPKGNAFIVTWPPKNGTVFVDTCQLNGLGNHFDAKNQRGYKFTGDWVAP